MSVEKCCNRNELFPLFHFVNCNMTIIRNSVVVDINYKSLNFNNLTKILLLLTMFIQRADNLANLIGTTIILTFANWQYKVQ